MKRMKPEEMPLLRELTLTYWGIPFFGVWVMQTIAIVFSSIKNHYGMQLITELYLYKGWYIFTPPVGILLSWIAEQYFLFVRHIFMTKGKRYDGKIVKEIVVKSHSGRLRKDRIMVIEYDNGKRFKTPRYDCYGKYTWWGDRCSVYVLFGMRYATDYETKAKDEVFKVDISKH